MTDVNVYYYNICDEFASDCRIIHSHFSAIFTNRFYSYVNFYSDSLYINIYIHVL